MRTLHTKSTVNYKTRQMTLRVFPWLLMRQYCQLLFGRSVLFEATEKLFLFIGSVEQLLVSKSVQPEVGSTKM